MHGSADVISTATTKELTQRVGRPAATGPAGFGLEGAVSAASGRKLGLKMQGPALTYSRCHRLLLAGFSFTRTCQMITTPPTWQQVPAARVYCTAAINARLIEITYFMK